MAFSDLAIFVNTLITFWIKSPHEEYLILICTLPLLAYYICLIIFSHLCNETVLHFNL